MLLYTCFQNHVIHAFCAHFFAKLKSEMAELSSGLGNSDEFITLSRGRGEARVDRKLKKTFKSKHGQTVSYVWGKSTDTKSTLLFMKRAAVN